MLRRTASAAIASMALLGTAALAAPAAADSHGADPSVEVVATGLNSPRKLSFAPNGDLYIAESGVAAGESGACGDHPEFGETCVYDTGSITLLSRHGEQSRIVEGLPSAVSASDAIGPFDVLVHGRTLTVAMGMGGSLEFRDSLGEDGALFGTVVDVKLMGRSYDVSVRADLLAFEAANDPFGGGIDSNPVDLSEDGRNLVVTDAGANDVLAVAKKGGVTDVLAVLDPVLTDPPFPGAPDPFPAQPVPTATVQGPDGHWYIGQLTGFPFPQGGSTVYRLSDGELEPYATGLTNVTDLAWDGDTLYAVQISDTGLLGGVMGSLVRIESDGSVSTVVDGLFAPYGVAIRDGYAYVTTGSVAPGGTVIKVALG
ncbi:ScyD/ScyE family protein [Tessaracoccus oleiagri]|uniref:ScyD/ScyE family protein n=1 Tax=Tessaracoccus oleiagri TaxID=686624 RepID=A0A1G9MAZ2_9ACTN|nr:ScyD/ScyE family protein [Tessaracoccus oleiagri]SDL71379.1 hypothetical protein SAMN04488242_2513 [Tessaracoccus oleiagri]